eukprot:15451254-Alexandrium_andersonii.AAC.2
MRACVRACAGVRACVRVRGRSRWAFTISGRIRNCSRHGRARAGVSAVRVLACSLGVVMCTTRTPMLTWRGDVHNAYTFSLAHLEP